MSDLSKRYCPEPGRLRTPYSPETRANLLQCPDRQTLFQSAASRELQRANFLTFLYPTIIDSSNTSQSYPFNLEPTNHFQGPLFSECLVYPAVIQQSGTNSSGPREQGYVQTKCLISKTGSPFFPFPFTPRLSKRGPFSETGFDTF